jgi:hypothetical protein
MSDRASAGADVESMVDKWLEEPDASSSTSETEGDEAPADQAAPEGEGQPQQRAEADATPNKPTSGQDKPTGDAKPPAQPTQTAKPGDLVDRDGRVIARAGAERRHYEAASRFRGEAAQYKQQLDKVTTELHAFREAAQMPTQLGLSPDESATGLQLMASWKANPVGVLQYLVEQAKAAGHNVDTLGGPTTDVGAIKQMIAQELAPFRQQSQAVQQSQQIETAAQQQVDQLVGDYGEQALTNSPALAKLIDASAAQGRPMTVEQAYLRFNAWCYQQGFDPHQPIDPQMAARSTPPATQQRTPPRPNGRAVAAPNGVIPMDAHAGISGSETTRDLVRASMRDAGFNV